MQLGFGISPGSFRQSGTTAFTPASIAGLQLWLDASDSGTLYTDSAGSTPATADGDPVGRWADKSANTAHALQTDGTQKPTLKLAIKNSKNVCRFNSTSSKMLGTLLAKNTDCTMVAVLRMNTSDASWRAALTTGFHNSTTATSGQIHGLIKQNNTSNKMLVTSFTGATDGNPSQSMGANWASCFATFTDTGTNASRIWTNETAAVGDPKTVTAITDQGYVYYIGRGLQAASEFWNGDLAELMIYNVSLDATNQTFIQNYLNSKWGVY
jgi:hypothetical protein